MLHVLFHDSGFITQSKNHEELSCEIVREALPDFNYTHEEIDSICGMIMATKIPQSPTNLLEQIIADADLDYLGREDYWEISNNLFKEISFFGIFTENDWLQLQINFLEKHRYFTHTAITTREAKKQETLGILKMGLK